MIRLILVRHGNTFEEGQTPVQIGARTDLPLTAFGLLQAERMAHYLVRQKIYPQAIFSGPLKRQMQFAAILGTPVLNEPALTEIDYSAWEGLTSKEISEKWPQEYADWNERSKWADRIFKNSENHHKDGIDLWLSHLRKTHRDGDVIVGVSSNGLLRFFGKREKVKTGHFCDLTLLPQGIKVNEWNLSPTQA